MAVVFVVYLTICKNKADLDDNSYDLDYGEITSTGDGYGVTNAKVESFDDENGVNRAGI